MGAFAYLDASAIAKLVVADLETAALERYCTAVDGLLTSRLGALETKRAAQRAGDRRILQRVDEVLESFVLVDVTRHLLIQSASVEPSSLRTLDALHLATALGLDLPDMTFVTYDKRLADAARAAGLVVKQPG